MDGAWVAWWGVAQEVNKDQPVCQIEMSGHYLRVGRQKLLSRGTT